MASSAMKSRTKHHSESGRAFKLIERGHGGGYGMTYVAVLNSHELKQENACLFVLNAYPLNAQNAG